MRIKVYIFILVISSSFNFLFAESHSVNENFGKEFEQAVKNVESKNFTAAVKKFTSLANQNLPEAQLIYHFYILMVWVLPKTLKVLCIGLGRRI